MPPQPQPQPGTQQSVFRSLVSYRIQLYTLVSFAAVSAVVLNALRSYSNFYSVATYLSKSGRSVLVLANFTVLLALFCGHVVQRIFFGSLRPNEVERLYDRLWFFITESLLAFTIFRDEFDLPFVLMFGFLLFVKSFHWLASDRIEWMDQQPYPGPPALFHLRMTSLFLILWLTDFVLFVVAIDHTLTYGVGGMVLFASEYGILMASVMNTILKYLLSTYDLRRAGRRGGENAPPWENKSMWVFYIELGTDFLKLTTYLVFFTIIITFYGLPLNLIRDVYITARSFITRLRALHRYQTATRNMDQRYPNATAAELIAMSDRTCIICREDMFLADQAQVANNDGPNVTPKKLPCGHIFHFHCLRSWLERQQSCPTCRQTVLEMNAPQATPANGPAQPPAPQQGNNPGGNNNPAMNNPIGNPLGLLGRMFNPPPQFANRNPLGPTRTIQNQGANNQHNPIVIEYRIQYQAPPTPGGTAGSARDGAQNPPATLQPIQPLEGFPGPNGEWQQWPGDTAITNRGALRQAGTTVETDGVSSVNPHSTDEQMPAEAKEDPKAAAAQAALRRLAGGPSSSSGNLPSTSSAHVAAPPTSSTSSIPRFIPLFSPSVPEASQPRTPVVSPHQYTSSHLPQHFTDAQLALMDNLTREAIDERLRILENVSGTVHRCVEDLLRVRSALPVVQTPNEGLQQPVASATEVGDGTRTARLDKGKGVDRDAPAHGTSFSGCSSAKDGSDGSFETFEM